MDTDVFDLQNINRMRVFIFWHFYFLIFETDTVIYLSFVIKNVLKYVAVTDKRMPWKQCAIPQERYPW